MSEKKKIAIILFNLGGPDSLDTVKPFLFNLFYDPYIIRAPKYIRLLIAKYISWRREETAKDIYRQIGGKSPILEQTQDQAYELEGFLNGKHRHRYKVFVAMRYWHPFIDEVLEEIVSFSADEILLLPLYPQFSTTTTRSFYAAWNKACPKPSSQVKTICCYPSNPGFTEAIARKLVLAYNEVETQTRILFSAHGLPKSIVESGDPYQLQVELTVKEILQRADLSDPDYVICYQSRVGPVEWLKPYTDAEIKRAGIEKISVIIVPVAFVSEHSETLVELDIEYKHLARAAGVPTYKRIETVQTDRHFIKGLANMVTHSIESDKNIITDCKQLPCDNTRADCPLRGDCPLF